jgi:adenosine deaminase
MLLGRACPAAGSAPVAIIDIVTLSKIELHVHLAGTVRAQTLPQIARRNGVSLPADTVQGRGCGWDEVFTGFCDGAREAWELHGVQVRLTPDSARIQLETAEQVARYPVAYADRGVVGLGLGASEVQYPHGRYQRAFAIGRDGGLAPLPHAGEAAGPDSIRGAVEMLGAASSDYAAAAELGVSARDCYAAGLRGALCDAATLDRLRAAGDAFDWAGPDLVAESN